jgi:hypothetical protein
LVLLVLGLAIGSFVATARGRRSATRRDNGSAAPLIDPAHVRRTTLRFMALFVVLYLAGIYATKIFLDMTLPISVTDNFLGLLAASRIFLPVLPLLLCIVLIAAENIGRGIGSALGERARWDSLFVGGLFVLILGGFVTYPWVSRYDKYVASWLPRPAFAASPVLAAVRHVDHSALVTSARPDLVWLAARRPAVKFPQQEVWLTGKRNPSFDEQLAELARLMCRRGGVAVSFGPPGISERGLAPLRRHAELTLVAGYPDGSLLAVTSLKGAPASACRPVPVPR